MNCQKCGTLNESGNKYCKECGQKLHDDSQSGTLTVDEHLRIGELIYTAYKESEAGRLDDAILACQGAIALNKNNASAHSLLGSLYERKGDVASAIYEYEKAVELNRGSLADRQKLEVLRAGIMSPAAPSSTPRRLQFRNLKPIAPYAAAAVGFVLVLLLGIALMKGEPGKPDASAREPSQEQSQAARRPAGTRVPGQQFAPGGYQQDRGTSQAYQPGYIGQQPREQPGTRQPAAPGQDGSGLSRSAGTKASKSGIPSVPLPGAPARPPLSQEDGRSETTSEAQEPPVIVPVIEPSPRGGTTSPAPSVTVAPPAVPTPAEAPTVVHAPSEPTINPEERGMQLQRMGKYQEAINAYREALNQTSDPGRVYQHVARCYQRLGQHDLAIDSYNRAIRSYRDQLAAGRDQAEVARSIRSCEAGVEVSRNQKRSEQ